MNIANELEWLNLVVEILDAYPNGAVIGLSGPLGAGKTSLVRSFIGEVARRNGLKIPRVVSPSFVFHQAYAELSPPVDHFDLYRLENISESTLRELGVFEAQERGREKKGFVFIEWPEKISAGAFCSDFTLTITIAAVGRRVTKS